MPELAPKTKMQPIIAVTMKAEGYGDWVRQGGGKPRLVVPGMQNPLRAVSGLLLTGGGDIDPALYGEDNRRSRRVDRERDKFELDLLQQALSRNLPVLGVCRGMQLLVVAGGGSLYQDLSELIIDSDNRDRVCHRGHDHTDTDHPVEIEPNSFLAGSIGQPGQLTLSVNSHHHQGIRNLPAGLRISARSRDGLIEAVESASDRCVRGIQWHPERWRVESSGLIMKQFLADAAREKITLPNRLGDSSLKNRGCAQTSRSRQ